jgi:hypothetical protein
MSSEMVLVDKSDAIALITLNRPKAMNALCTRGEVCGHPCARRHPAWLGSEPEAAQADRHCPCEGDQFHR